MKASEAFAALEQGNKIEIRQRGWGNFQPWSWGWPVHNDTEFRLAPEPPLKLWVNVYPYRYYAGGSPTPPNADVVRECVPMIELTPEIKAVLEKEGLV